MSTYTCINTDCALNASAASFPEPMPCPVCQQPLQSAVSLSPEEEGLIARLPYVIACPLRAALLEENGWTKINLLKDTLLNYLKFLGLLAASEFFHGKKNSRHVVNLFHSNLAEPSFGTWLGFIRECIAFMNEQGHSYICPELPIYVEQVQTGKKRKLLRGDIQITDMHGEVQIKKQQATRIEMLINFRNRFLGHGLTLDGKESMGIWNDYWPIMRSLLVELEFADSFRMYRRDGDKALLLHGPEITEIEEKRPAPLECWLESPEGEQLPVLPFYITPGELAMSAEEPTKVWIYESYTGRTLKFFRPEGNRAQETSGELVQRLNLLLKAKAAENRLGPEELTPDRFRELLAAENAMSMKTLEAERKVIPGIYQNRAEIESELRAWIGARASIFFISARAGSGKTNLLVEILRQYQEQDLSTYLIRASRMECSSLKEEIAHQLCLQPDVPLERFAHLSGTQARPNVFLLDGLNEAQDPAGLWQELVEISSAFVPGSLKWVVTYRADSSSDLDGLGWNEAFADILYHKQEEGAKDLGSCTFWLTPMDMKETAQAWAAYSAKKGARFKPRFSFNDLATHHRYLYSELSNPLVLKVFMELYHNKPLPKPKKAVRVWKEWTDRLLAEERVLLDRLVLKVWGVGENALLLDDLLKDEKLAPFLLDDNIGAPYLKLRNTGWLSRYHSGGEQYLAFTVEAILFHLLGLWLRTEGLLLDQVLEMLQRKDSLSRGSLSQALIQEVLDGELDLLAALIDNGGDALELSVVPAYFFIKAHGVEPLVHKLFEEPTQEDWDFLDGLDDRLDEEKNSQFRRELFEAVMPINPLNTEKEVLIGLKACRVLPKKEAGSYITSLREINLGMSKNRIFIQSIGNFFEHLAEYDDALVFFEKALAINIQVHGELYSDTGSSFNSIGSVWRLKCEYDKAIEYFEKSLAIALKVHGEAHPSTGTSYNNLGLVWSDKGEHDKAVEYYEKSLAIDMKVHGEEHPSTGASCNNLGAVWCSKGEYDKAIEYLEKSLAIVLKVHGDNHSHTGTSYDNLGAAWSNKGEYDKAIEYFEKSLFVNVQVYGEEHASMGSLYNTLSLVCSYNGEYDKAIEYYEKSLAFDIQVHGEMSSQCAAAKVKLGNAFKQAGRFKEALAHFEEGFSILKKGGFLWGMAECHEELKDEKTALTCYVQCAELRRKDLGFEDEATQDALKAAQRLAKKLSQEEILPQWMRSNG